MDARRAADILASLSADEIQSRLQELEREARALRVLLRAVRQCSLGKADGPKPIEEDSAKE